MYYTHTNRPCTQVCVCLIVCAGQITHTYNYNIRHVYASKFIAYGTMQHAGVASHLLYSILFAIANRQYTRKLDCMQHLYGMIRLVQLDGLGLAPRHGSS